MAKDRLLPREPAPVESSSRPAEPSQFAELEISVGPAHRARGKVPPDQAHHLITTFGILGSAATGVGGVVLTLDAVPHSTALAFGELALAMATAALIALCGRQKGERLSNPEDRKATAPEEPSS